MILRRTAYLIMCAAGAACVMLCSHPSSVVTTGGSEVVGMLVMQNGTPVVGATVRLDTASSSSDTSYEMLDSTSTDAKGNFVFRRNHGGGAYSIYGDYHNGELVVLVRDIKDTVTSNVFHEVNVGTHTMYPPGFISGKVVIDEPTLTGTICYIPGTSLSAITGDDGTFAMSGVPADTYRVYFTFPNYLVGRDPGVIVTSGDTTNVGTMVLSFDPNKGVPTPRLVSVSYDTLHGVVRVSWNSVHVSDLRGYVVYRGLNGNPIEGRDTLPITDTLLLDTIYSSYLDTAAYTCQYEVAAFDSAPNFSNRSNPVTIVTAPPSSVRTVFSFQVSGAVKDTAELGDTLVIGALFSNQNNPNSTVSWYSVYPDSALQQDLVNAKVGTDTLRHVFASSGRGVLYVAAVDDHGISWLDSVVVSIRPHHVDAVSCDSTFTGVTLRWNTTHQPDFAAYRLFRALPAGGDTLLYAATSRSDTSHSILLSTNGVFQYCIAVLDSQGRVSPRGKSIGAWIKNTPPKFTNDTASIPKAASVGNQYRFQLAAADVNGDPLTLVHLDSLGVTLSGTTLSWTPTILDTGVKHIAIQVRDGFGGYDTLAWNVRVTPVSICAWGDSMITPRFSLSATVLNGTLYAAGGAKFFNSGGRLIPIPLSNVEAYPLSGGGTWTKAASFASPRYALGLAGYGSQLFSFGGTKDGVNHFATVDSISVNGTAWDTAATLPVAFAGSAVCVVGSKVYCMGGLTKVAGADVVSNSIYEFDPATGQCVLKASMQTPRTFHQVAVLNGKIYIIGGLGGSSSEYECVAQSSVEVYDPAAGAIQPVTAGSLTTPRYYFGAAETNGKLYALGGCYSANSDASLSSIEEYDPAINLWTVKADLPTTRSNFAAVSWQGTVYVIGGIVAGQATNSVVIYYP